MSKLKSQKLCPCGSGKKYKRCCWIKKPRQEYIYATTAGEVSQISLTYDPQTDGFMFETPMVGMFNQTSYTRHADKKPKILNQTPIRDQELFFSPDKTLIDEFDMLFAIDTNTKPIDNNIISVSCLILGLKIIDGEKGNDALKWYFPFCLEFMNVNVSAERLALKILIDHIQSEEKLRAMARIGIIVDSDYATIARCNERTVPIILDYYLPKNIHLVYATADGGTEYIANKMIRDADKVAAIILKKIETGEIPLNKKVVQGRPYSSFRKMPNTLPDEKPPFQIFQ